MRIEQNNVSAEQQVQKRNYIGMYHNGGKINVLFIGNSITRHEPKPEIGWDHDWGMAASCKENDYVHVAVKLLEGKFGKEITDNERIIVHDCDNHEMTHLGKLPSGLLQQTICRNLSFL